MKAILLAVSCFLVLPLVAQDAPRVAGRPPVVPSPTTQASEEGRTLKENITIRLHGTTTNGTDIDLSLSGIGPSFTADQVVNDDTMLTCEYVVSETETGYRVSYSVGARIKVPTQANPNTTNIEYRDIIIRGTVLCSKKKAHVLVQNGTKSLKLTVTKDSEQ
jgi:hypothetical protein